MNTMIKKIAVTTFATTFALSSFISIAASTETTATNETTLKSVMQGLLKDSVAINKGIFLEDFTMIEQAANLVANHPTPSMATRKKLMMNLGLEMGNFKSLDTVVHDLSVEIGEAAKKEDMKTVVVKYHKLIDGCLSCHNSFKKRVSEILK